MIAEYGAVIVSTLKDLAVSFSDFFNSIESIELFAAIAVLTVLFVLFKR